MFNETVSTYETFGSAPENIKLSQWLRSTMDPNYKFVEQVKRYRSTRREYLKKSLPKIMPGAICEGGHAMEHVVSRTGWISLDIDAKDNPDYSAGDLKEAISNIVYVAFSGFSVSGRGVWALIKVKEPKKQATYFEQLQADFKNRNIFLDSTKGRNPNDLRFYSFDPNAYLADDFKVYDRLPEGIPTSKPIPRASGSTTHTKSKDTQSKVEALISQIQDHRTDITSGYENWRDLAFALEDEFGEQGRNFFHVISQFHPEYSEKETNKQYTKCMQHPGSGIHIGTFFHRCQKHKITFNQNHRPSIDEPLKANYETNDPAPYGVNPYTGEVFDERGYPSEWDTISFK